MSIFSNQLHSDRYNESPSNSLAFQGRGVPRLGGHPQEDDQESKRGDEEGLSPEAGA